MTGGLYRHRRTGELWRAVWNHGGADGDCVCLRSYPGNGKVELVPVKALDDQGEFIAVEDAPRRPNGGAVVVVGRARRAINAWLTAFERQGRRAYLSLSAEEARERAESGDAVLAVVSRDAVGDRPGPVEGLGLPQILVCDRISPDTAEAAVSAGFLFVICADDGSRLAEAVNRVMCHHEAGPAHVLLVEGRGRASDRGHAALEAHGLVVHPVPALDALFTCGGLVTADAVVFNGPDALPPALGRMAALRASPEWTAMPFLVRDMSGPGRPSDAGGAHGFDVAPDYPSLAARIKERVALARGLPRWIDVVPAASGTASTRSPSPP